MRLPATLLLLTILLAACSSRAQRHDVAIKAPAAAPKRVVIVHGIFDTRITMIPLRRALEKEGFECFVPSLGPADGRDGLEPMAKQLAKDIEAEFGPEAQFSIVAFSMGGLVSRHYLQELGGAKRCCGLHTIATPHQGTWLAYLYPGTGTRQMRPDSPFLTALKDGEKALATLPVTAYHNPFDGVVLPSKNSTWDHADNVTLKAPLHPGLLWNKHLHTDLITRLHKEHKP